MTGDFFENISNMAINHKFCSSFRKNLRTIYGYIGGGGLRARQATLGQIGLKKGWGLRRAGIKMIPTVWV